MSLVPAPLLYVSTAVMHFISTEVVHMIDVIFPSTPFAPLGQVPSVAVMNIEMIIYVAVEVMRAMEPRASANEDAAYKPLRSVVSIGSARIRRVVIVAVRAYRFGSNGDADLSF
jgi:hypothetical protein